MARSCSSRTVGILAGMLLGPVLLLAMGCATLSVEEEKSLGAQFEREVRREVVFVRDDVVVNYVRAIGQGIVKAAGPQPFDYSFYVIEDDTINAFAGPAGHIYVHTETVLAAANASELAGVIAHEVGHVVRRHVAENYGRARTTGIVHQVGVVLASLLGGSIAAGAANVGGGLAATAYLNSYSREAEREADAFAVVAMPRAGWDPDGLVTFFETLLRQSGGDGPSWLSSHPTTQDRIRETRAMIAESRPPGHLKVRDGGRLEIIQRRIRLLMGQDAGGRP